jgi:chromosome partitioning protein
MFDGRLNLSRQVAQEARKYFNEKVYETVISRNVRLSEAPSFGKPIILYDILSAGAENYISLAKEVLSK